MRRFYFHPQKGKKQSIDIKNPFRHGSTKRKPVVGGSCCAFASASISEPVVATVKFPDMEPSSRFPESCTGSSDTPLSAVMAVRTVAVRVSGSSKSSMDVQVGIDFSVSASGAKVTISPLAPIEVSASSAIAEIGNMVRTMHTDSQILIILFLTLSHPPILIFFSASNIRLHPAHVAYPDESQHNGSTSTAVSPPVYRPSAQKPDKLVLATHCLPHWGQKRTYPPACADDFP